MPGYERFHLCLLAVDTDIPSALRIHPDVVGMQQPVSYTHLNIDLDDNRRPMSRKYFDKLPESFRESALLDRFHCFIEGWLSLIHI